MQYDDFVGQVQHRAHLEDGGAAVRAIHATLETLSERLDENEAEDLAAQLPPELGFFLQQPRFQAKFDLEEFFERVAVREETRVSSAMHHARAVISVLCDAVSPGEIADVRNQLSHDFARLFETDDQPSPEKAGHCSA